MTNCIRPIISARERKDRGQLTAPGPGVCNIIKDPNDIHEIERILQGSRGFNIVEEKRAFVLEGELRTDNPEDEISGEVMPVVREEDFERGLSQVAEKAKQDREDIIQTFEMELSHEVPKKVARTPKGPTKEEREAHESTHCPFRPWCDVCVMGKAPDPGHPRMTEESPDAVPVIEFDYSSASGVVSDPEHKLPLMSAGDSEHGSVFSTIIWKKGSSDEYVM